jgi:dTDP-4-amino-4,6-dideoxygalactose transaminase
MSYSIPLFDLNFDEAEERAVLEVLRSKWISMGPKTAELETRFAQYVGAKHAIAVSSCSAALHLALAALGIGQGDEVIVPSLTFVATVNAVRYVGATPVFADIVGHDDFSIDPKHVAALIGPRTRAILPMHYAGFACDMEALCTLAAKHGLAMVEDAAHAPATTYRGQHVGTFGDAGCFSFFANKNMTCAEGGMLVTNRDDLAERARLMRSHGMTTLSYDRARGHATTYDVVVPGYNYRLDDIRAAIALVQLEKIPAETRCRVELRAAYLAELEGAADITVPYRTHNDASSHYILPLVLTRGGLHRREAIRRDLAASGIQTSVHYPAVHRFSIYRGLTTPLPHTEYVADREFTLPLFGTLTTAQVRQVISALVKSLACHPE